MSFGNLFNDATISSNLNTILNQSSDLIFNEIKHPFGVARGKIVQKLIAPIFEMFPYKKLFAE